MSTCSQLALLNKNLKPNTAWEDPLTGKACNQMFSRPYELTRHEDTIHRTWKQKLWCHLCTKEKTFSRKDGLTMHKRVVHQDVVRRSKIDRGTGIREGRGTKLYGGLRAIKILSLGARVF
jgi:Zinc finger, C2H2 type